VSICYWKNTEKQAKNDTIIPEHNALRWALEEFRVSLFAQNTKPLILYPLNAWINYRMNMQIITS